MLLGEEVVRGCESLQAEPKLLLKFPQRTGRPRGLAGNCLDNSEKILGAMDKLTHQHLGVRFRFFALRDVHYDIGDTLRLPVRSARDHAAAPGDPQLLSIRPDDPVLARIGIFSVGGTVELLHHVLIVGMERDIELVIRPQDLPTPTRQIKAEELHSFHGPDPSSAHHVRFPCGDPAGDHRRAVTRFTCGKAGLDRLSLGNIYGRRQQALLATKLNGVSREQNRTHVASFAS